MPHGHGGGGHHGGGHHGGGHHFGGGGMHHHHHGGFGPHHGGPGFRPGGPGFHPGFPHRGFRPGGLFPPIRPFPIGPIRPIMNPIWLIPPPVVPRVITIEVTTGIPDEFIFYEINNVDQSDFCTTRRVQYYMKMKNPKYKRFPEEVMPPPVFVERVLQEPSCCEGPIDESHEVAPHSEWIAFAGTQWKQQYLPPAMPMQQGMVPVQNMQIQGPNMTQPTMPIQGTNYPIIPQPNRPQGEFAKPSNTTDYGDYPQGRQESGGQNYDYPS